MYWLMARTYMPDETYRYYSADRTISDSLIANARPPAISSYGLQTFRLHPMRIYSQFRDDAHYLGLRQDGKSSVYSTKQSTAPYIGLS